MIIMRLTLIKSILYDIPEETLHTCSHGHSHSSIPHKSSSIQTRSLKHQSINSTQVTYTHNHISSYRNMINPPVPPFFPALHNKNPHTPRPFLSIPIKEIKHDIHILPRRLKQLRLESLVPVDDCGDEVEFCVCESTKASIKKKK